MNRNDSTAVSNLKAALCAVAVCAVLTSAPAAAVDGVSVEYGRGNSADIGRVGVQWDWNKKWLQTGDWHLGGYWDLSVGY